MEQDIDFILSIATRRRFAATFWKTLIARRREDPSVTRRSVFDFLEGEYERVFHESLWNYNSFRHSREFRDRNSRKI